MFSLNRIDIIGYQTEPVTLRATPGGTNVTDLNIVVPLTITTEKGEKITSKSFHTVTLWGAMADIAGQYVKPGSHLFLSGRLQTDSWDDPQTSEKRSKTKIVALEMIFLDAKDGQITLGTTPKELNTSLNTAQILGNLTKDPEIRTTTNGQSVVSFGVATNERWKEKGTNELKERTEFHNVIAWGELAKEITASVKKGQKIHVSGRVQTRAWETQTGQKRTTTEIIAERVTLVGVRNNDALSNIKADAGFATSPAPSAPQDSSISSDVSSAPSTPMPEIKYESDIKPEDLPF
jgi:single-strand DNA-binding protein